MTAEVTGRSVRTIVAVSFVDALGTGAFLTGSVVYAVRVLGQRSDTVGVAASAAVFAAILVTVPAGRLADRWSPRLLLLSCGVFRVILFAALPFASSVPAYVLLVVAAAVAEAAARPAQMRLLFLVTPAQDRTTARASMRNSYNVGAAVGALAASLPLALDTPAALQGLVAVNIASFLAVSAITLLVPDARRAADQAGDAAHIAAGRPDLLRFVFLAVSSGVVVGVGAGVLETGLPLQITQRTAAPTWTISGVFVVNAVFAIALQRGAAARIDTVLRGVRGNVLAAVVLGAAVSLIPVAAVATRATSVVVVGVVAVLLTVSEVVAAAASWALSYGLARERSQAQDVAAFGLAGQVSAAVTPAIAAVAVSREPIIWLCIAGAVIVVGVASAGVLATHFPCRYRDDPEESR